MGLAIKAENLSKAYRLGQFNTGALSKDIERWWALARGKEDPFLKIGESNDRSTKGNSNVVWSLKDINLEVEQGDTVGIIGKNGAGKSTLLKLLSRVTSPTTGSVKLKGRVASLLEVGTGFHPELTGRENIFLNGAILGMRKCEIRNRFDEIVDFAGIERYIDTPVKRYSSGMYVRLAFAVAAHLESEILIVDEVLAVGDAEFQKKCLGKMGDISKGQGRTILFVSHNMASIEALCSNSILLEYGRKIYEGKTNSTIKEYLKKSIDQSSDLSQSIDRQGAGNIRILKVELIEEKASDVPFAIGTKFDILIHYSVMKDVEFRNPRVLIGVYNELNEGVTRFDSDSSTSLSKTLPAKGLIECSIKDNINLMPGNYHINVALFNSGNMEDYIVEKVGFEVVDNNYLGTGKLFDENSLAKVVFKHDWNSR